MIDALGAYVLLASGIVANKHALRSVTPDALVGIRMFGGGLALLLLVLRTSPRLRWSYLKHDALILVSLTLCTSLLPALLKAVALSYMVASKQTIIGSVDPFITAVYAYLLWGERLTLRKFLGMVIGFCGVAIAVFDAFPEEAVWSLGGIISVPVILVFIAVALGRYGWMVVQTLLRNDRYTPEEMTGMCMFLSGIGALLISLARGRPMFLQQELPWAAVGALVYTTFIGNVCGYTLHSYALRRHNATFMALIGLSIPLLVAFFSWISGLEGLSLRFFCGVAVLTLGMVVFYSDHIKSGAAKRSTL